MKSTAIYGPPGTGKTTWMMNKISELLTQGYSASDIMYLSFTKAATGEALRRMGLKRSDTVSTIHSACYRMCGMSGAAVVTYAKLKKFSELVGIPFKGNSDDSMETMELGDMFLSLHSLARNRMNAMHDEYEQSSRPGSWNDFSYFVESYDEWKRSNGLIDFTDMLERYSQDPVEHPCRVVFIDESQDLSPLQWKVIDEIVTMPGVELVFFAGDDDQAIYEWAGADPHGMAVFEEKHDARRVVLDQSYRIPNSVHKVVMSIAQLMDRRVEKKYSPRDEEGEVINMDLYDPQRQSEGFVLCRTHSIKQKVERMLIEDRIPFLSDGGGLPGPFSCKGAKAIRAWKRYKDSGNLSQADLESMIAGAMDKVRADLIAGDHKSILGMDPMRSFKLPYAFLDYFRDVDIFTNPRLVTSTIHASKGREAPYVTLITDWTGRVAAGMSMNPDAEHRVWYVGASRAKQTLCLTSVGEPGYFV